MEDDYGTIDGIINTGFGEMKLFSDFGIYPISDFCA